MRKIILELHRRIKALEKVVPIPAQTEIKPEVKSKPVRITASRIKALRVKLGLSQERFALLLGVSINSVCLWESGKIIPRDSQKLKIVSIRDMKKRELAKLMTEKNIMGDSSRKLSKVSIEAGNEQQKQSEKAKSEAQGEKATARS